MTTSVIYDSTVRGLNMAQRPGTSIASAGASLSAIYSNLSTLFTTGVTQVQSINNSASTTNPTATFTNTPTNGNAMIAIIIRGADNVASTNASWTLLDSAGTAGTRRLEFWWRRAGASESKTHTWTNATAGLWECTLLEFGGWATKADPTSILPPLNVATNTSYTYPSVGVLCGVQALVTSGGSAGTFTDTGTNAESVTNIGVTTTTRFRQFIVDAYTNRETQTIQNSWTTSRPFTVGSVGWANGNSTDQGSFGLGVGNDSTANGTNAVYAAQIGYSYDTSSIPSANTVTSVTATYQAAGGASGFPSVATLDVYEQDDLIARAKAMGVVMKRMLDDLKAKHPSVGDIRSIGLFGIVEVVRSRKTMEPMAPFNGSSPEMQALAKFFREKGLYTFVRWNGFFTNPPLSITEQELAEGFAIIDEGLSITDKAVS